MSNAIPTADPNARSTAYQVTLKSDCIQQPPGSTYVYRLTAGEKVWCEYLVWPGKPQAFGIPSPDWSFWTSHDIDGAIIFKPDQLTLVEYHADTAYAPIFNLPGFCPVPVKEI